MIDDALTAGKTWLSEPSAKALMAAYDIPTAKTLVAKTPHEAAALAAEFGGGVAIKILSDDILHKSDVGGVALDLFGPRSCRRGGSGNARAGARCEAER